MWKQKIGISIQNKYKLPLKQVIQIIKQTGFDGISPSYENDEILSEIHAAAKECNLTIHAMHAPFGKAKHMWSDDTSLANVAKGELLAAISACAKFGIPTLVVHTWIGFKYTFDAASLHFERFDEVVAFAKENGIQIAFENTEGEEYLFALMERYKNNDTVGFCWDSGHEMCYNRSKDLLQKFGERLYMTHLNDNLGISRFDGTIYWTDDLHLLPFDGIADWEDNVARLKQSRTLEFLNFELNINSKPDRHENDCYGQMPLEQYFAEAYKRACKIAYNYSK